jgi:hypothetical protein
MKKYLAIFNGGLSEGEKMEITPLEYKAFMEEWMKWAQENSQSIVDNGTPLGKTKKIDSMGTTDIKNQMVTYTILQAESHDDVARILARHPHVTLFPKGSIEVMECLPMPEISK